MSRRWMRGRRARRLGAARGRAGLFGARPAGLCLVWAVLVANAPAARADHVRLTTELADLRELGTRLELAIEGLPALGPARLLWIDVRGQDGVSDRAFGLSAEGLLFGPVLPAGLLRELAGPLGWAPASDVYREPSGLRLDTGLSPFRRGLAIGGPARGCTLYLMRAGPVLCSGFLLARSGRPGSGAELLLGASEPPADPPEDAWYPEQPAHPGGLLCHAGARVARRGAGFGAAAAAALSVGERVPPGAFLRCSLHGEDRRWEGDLLAAAASAGWVSPEGGPADWSRSVGMRLRFGAGDAFSASGEYRLRTAPPCGWPTGWREAREEIAVDLQGGAGLGARAVAHGALSCDVCRRFQTDGTISRGIDARLDADVRLPLEAGGAWARCALWAGLAEDRGEWTAAGGLRWELEVQRGKGAWLEAEISARRGIEIALGAEFDARCGDFRCRFAVSPSGMESVVAWEVED